MTATATLTRSGFAATTLLTAGQQIGDFMADTIIELATTPSTYALDSIVHSTVHRAMMRWTGTQWVFADGPPSYLAAYQGFNPQTTTTADWNPAVIGAGAVQSAVAGLGLQHPGIALITSNGANQGAMIRTGSFVSGASPGVRFRGVFYIPVGGIGGTVTARIGLHDSSTTADAANGCYLEIVGPTASFKTADNSVRTTNATTATLVDSTWYTAHIWFLTATTARCVIVRDDGTIMLDVTNVANVPILTRQLSAAIVSSNTSATPASLLNIDFIGVGYAAV